MAYVRHIYHDFGALQPRLIDVSGRVAITTSGAVSTKTGRGFTVTKTGTGLYSIKLDAQGSIVPDILSVLVDVGFATGTAQLMVKVLTISAATATITLQTSTVAAPNTAADLTTGSFLMLRVVVQNQKQNY